MKITTWTTSKSLEVSNFQKTFFIGTGLDWVINDFLESSLNWVNIYTIQEGGDFNWAKNAYRWNIQSRRIRTSNFKRRNGIYLYLFIPELLSVTTLKFQVQTVRTVQNCSEFKSLFYNSSSYIRRFAIFSDSFNVPRRNKDVSKRINK